MFVFAITDPYLRIVTTVLAALIGLCVGSFLNVVIYRVPLHMSLASPPSHCPACGYRLRPYDNIPILSYIMLRGRCRQCGTHISFRYTAVEAANMLLWTLCALLFADNIGWMVLSAVSVSVCICIAFVDLEHTEIPDRFQVALALPAIAAVCFDTAAPFWSHLIGAGVGFASFFLVGKLVSLKKGREALGFGDVKFAAVAGLLLGWERLILMVLLASVSAAVVLTVHNRRHGEDAEMPFAPFLCAGTLIALLFGDRLIELYLMILSAP